MEEIYEFYKTNFDKILREIYSRDQKIENMDKNLSIVKINTFIMIFFLLLVSIINVYMYLWINEQIKEFHKKFRTYNEIEQFETMKLKR